jgi:hypothetical protein
LVFPRPGADYVAPGEKLASTYEVEQGRVCPHGPERGAEEYNLELRRAERREVKVWRLVLRLVLVFSLPLGHVLQVEDGPPLRVVEAGGTVEEAEEEQRREDGGHRLKAVAPAQRPKKNNK